MSVSHRFSQRNFWGLTVQRGPWKETAQDRAFVVQSQEHAGHKEWKTWEVPKRDPDQIVTKSVKYASHQKYIPRTRVGRVQASYLTERYAGSNHLNGRPNGNIINSQPVFHEGGSNSPVNSAKNENDRYLNDMTLPPDEFDPYAFPRGPFTSEEQIEEWRKMNVDPIDDLAPPHPVIHQPMFEPNQVQLLPPGQVAAGPSMEPVPEDTVETDRGITQAANDAEVDMQVDEHLQIPQDGAMEMVQYGDRTVGAFETPPFKPPPTALDKLRIDPYMVGNYRSRDGVSPEEISPAPSTSTQFTNTPVSPSENVFYNKPRLEAAPQSPQIQFPDSPPPGLPSPTGAPPPPNPVRLALPPPTPGIVDRPGNLRVDTTGYPQLIEPLKHDVSPIYDEHGAKRIRLSPPSPVDPMLSQPSTIQNIAEIAARAAAEVAAAQVRAQLPPAPPQAAPPAINAPVPGPTVAPRRSTRIKKTPIKDAAAVAAQRAKKNAQMRAYRAKKKAEKKK